VIRVEVQTSSGDYFVNIKEGLLRDSGRIIAEHLRSSRVAVIADATASELHGQVLRDTLLGVGLDVVWLEVPSGEASKSWGVAGDLLERLAAGGLERKDAIVAFGGGVAGDLAGFCAGVYMRGVDYFQIPTTLLSQVDSSVGGKTGVDLAAGKNLAGVFIQPKAVVADISLLSTLPKGEWESGLVEVAKSAILAGEDFLGWMERNASALVARDIASTGHAVEESVRLKAGVVAADEREAGLRESLNLGHTLGHAIEKVAGYGCVSHGVAVAWGIRFASRLAVRLGAAPPDFASRQERLLYNLGLTSRVGEVDADAILYAMRSDKKARDGVIRFVLAVAPGSHVVLPVEDRVIAEELMAFLAG